MALQNTMKAFVNSPLRSKDYCPWIIGQKTVAERLYDLPKAVKPDSSRSCSFPKSALGLLILTCLSVFKHLFYWE